MKSDSQEAQIVARVKQFQPNLKARSLPASAWASIEPEVAAKVLSIARTPDDAGQLLTATAGLVAWAHSQCLPTTADVLLRETTRERYLASVSDASRSSIRLLLNRLSTRAGAAASDTSASLVSDSVAGPLLADGPTPDVTTLGLADVPEYWDVLEQMAVLVRQQFPNAAKVRGGPVLQVPYGPADVAGYFAATETIRVSATRNAARAWLALGLGAGIVGKSAVTVGVPHLNFSSDRTCLSVRIPTASPPRDVEVLSPFVPLLASTAAGLGSALLLRTRAGGRAGPNRAFNLSEALARVGKHLPRAEASRLRATWLVVHLAFGTPLPTLLGAAGLTTVAALEPFVPFVPSLPRLNVATPWQVSNASE